MTREEVERRCEQISEWTKFSSRPIHHTVLRLLDHDAEQRKNIADQAMEITTCNLALLERDREIERLKQQYTQEIAKRDCRILELQSDLDQVVGQAVWAGEQLQFERASGWADTYDCAVTDDLVKGQLSGDTAYQRAEALLRSPLVQSWRARQGKEGV